MPIIKCKNLSVKFENYMGKCLYHASLSLLKTLLSKTVVCKKKKKKKPVVILTLCNVNSFLSSLNKVHLDLLVMYRSQFYPQVSLLPKPLISKRLKQLH